jgi:hypothetical protein
MQPAPCDGFTRHRALLRNTQSRAWPAAQNARAATAKLVGHFLLGARRMASERDADVQPLLDEVRQLRGRQAIRDCINRYNRALDRLDAELIASTYRAFAGPDCEPGLRSVSAELACPTLPQPTPAGFVALPARERNELVAVTPRAFARSRSKTEDYRRRRAVTSISIFMRGSASPAEIIIAAGLTAPKYLRSTGQHRSKSAALGSTYRTRTTSATLDSA